MTPSDWKNVRFFTLSTCAWYNIMYLPGGSSGHFCMSRTLRLLLDKTSLSLSDPSATSEIPFSNVSWFAPPSISFLRLSISFSISLVLENDSKDEQRIEALENKYNLKTGFTNYQPPREW